MIHSMTAFARHECSGEWGNLVWEIRSINHRFLDVLIRLPEGFRELEPQLRTKVREKLARGRVEINLTYIPPASTAHFSLNLQLLDALEAARGQIQEKIAALNAPTYLDVLAWPDVLVTQVVAVGQLHEKALTYFDESLALLLQARQVEGEKLQSFIAAKVQAIADWVTKWQAEQVTLMSKQQTRLMTKLQALKQDVDAARFEQELVLLLQRLDVTEELERLQAHIKQAQTILQENGAAGRRLDFLLQEFNREANTLGAKSQDLDMTASVVDIKVLIEQIREQVQNIE